jgi:hydroxymethylpyrimidine pyrophosphatase-like HAD family hydrolase
MKENTLIFTDLDGTLLDHQTYSYDKALLALQLVQKKEIPLIGEWGSHIHPPQVFQD